MRKAAIFAIMGAAALLAGCNVHGRQPSGNTSVPAPARTVELNRYLGKWYEIARYEAPFQKGCEAVTADYALRTDGKINVVNSCRQGSPHGALKSSTATARVIDGTGNARLKVQFFPPFEGDYWVLDHARDYGWSIVGEPSGKYLWILSRTPKLDERAYQSLVNRVAAMGYNTSILRRTRH